MWPFGHLAVAYILWVFLRRRFDWPVDRRTTAVVLVASLLPDLIDKPLAWGLGVVPASRSLGHSLLFFVPFLVVTVVVCRWTGRMLYAVAIVLGTVSHVVLDALPVLWDGEASAAFLVWPYRSVEAQDGAPSVLAVLRDAVTDPYFLLEFVLLAIALWLWFAGRHRPGSRS